MTPAPRVIVSVWGRFHGFDLARELQRHGALAALITSYPRFVAERFGIDGRAVHARPLSEVVVRAARRWGSAALAAAADVRCRQWYERSARRALARLGGNVFVGWSGTSLSLVRDARARGMITVVERGSSHIVEQEENLAREYASFGIRMPPFDRSIVAEELQEYAEADLIAVPSDFVVQSFLQRGFPRERLLVNPYGADLSAFAPAPEPHAGFRIIQVGAVAIRKGFRYVIEAFAQADLPDAELWFVGPVSAEAAGFLRDHPDPRVKFHGRVPQHDLPGWYNRCDVACLGSIEEGMAMVLLQAAACGLPIVCTENTGGRDLVGRDECGIVVPPRSVAGLAAAFRRLHADRDLARRLGREARHRSETTYSWEKYGERAIAAYTRALAGTDRGDRPPPAGAGSMRPGDARAIMP